MITSYLVDHRMDDGRKENSGLRSTRKQCSKLLACWFMFSFSLAYLCSFILLLSKFHIIQLVLDLLPSDLNADYLTSALKLALIGKVTLLSITTFKNALVHRS
jgi:hypothetical protein